MACLVLSDKYPKWRDDPSKDDLAAWEDMTRQAADMLSNERITHD